MTSNYLVILLYLKEKRERISPTCWFAPHKPIPAGAEARSGHSEELRTPSWLLLGGRDLQVGISKNAEPRVQLHLSPALPLGCRHPKPCLQHYARHWLHLVLLVLCSQRAGVSLCLYNAWHMVGGIKIVEEWLISWPSR